jgi:hypothetical protein
MPEKRSAKSFGETRAEVDKYPVIPAKAQREPESSRFVGSDFLVLQRRAGFPPRLTIRRGDVLSRE